MNDFDTRKQEQENLVKYECAALAGLLANPRYTADQGINIETLCTDARRYAWAMIRLRRTPAPRT